MPSSPDLVVLSHLRWTWVWQRPQHVVARLARARAAAGARTWFVEEPEQADVREPVLRSEEVDGVVRVRLEVPDRGLPAHRTGFDAPAAREYDRLLADLLARQGGRPAPDVWVWTPMALDLAQRLDPGLLVHDVMDDLASFKDAAPGLLLRQRRLLAEADVVFTGGPSLHAAVSRLRPDGVHLFRSGVDTAHYAASRALRTPQDPPVAGYVGVVDERLDLDLLAGLADALPDWRVRVVGPVAKIDPDDLPRRPNLEYPGFAAYDDLPAVMAGFAVALMPFALNDATRSISPTKTLEYLAAGLPVVSTRVPDVVADHADVVRLEDDARGFAAACRDLLDDDPDRRDLLAGSLRQVHEWDRIVERMSAVVEQARGTVTNAAAVGGATA